MPAQFRGDAYLNRTYVRISERSVTLKGGRFDGKAVVIDANAREIWAYQNMYGQARAVRAGGLPRSESMLTYRLRDDMELAELVEGS